MTIKLSVSVDPVDETVTLILLQEREIGGSGNYQEVTRQSLYVTTARTSRTFVLEPGASNDRISLTLKPGKNIIHDTDQNAVVME